MNLGQNLKSIRESKKLSQQEIAKNCEISQQALSLWEQNKRIPNILDLIKVADYLDISLDDLTERKRFF